jgi:hypothetical protein
MNISVNHEDRFQPPLDAPESRKPLEMTVRFRTIVAFYVMSVAVCLAIVTWSQTRPTDWMNVVTVVVALTIGSLLYAGLDFLKLKPMAVIDKHVLVRWFGVQL